MLRNVNELKGFDILARDGEIGEVDGFLFDDLTWTVRYLVVDTGRWLGRKVLIPPDVFETPLWEQEKFPVSLTLDEIEGSPDIDTDRPVSLQQQGALASYYGLAPWWNVWTPRPGGESEIVSDMMRKRFGETEPGDPHLRGTNEVTGYDINATDGEIGEVEGFIADDQDWVIRYLVVDTRKWLPGKRVIVSTEWVSGIDWSVEAVDVELTKEDIERSPEYDPERLSREYEQMLHEHYGRKGYWKKAA